MEENPKVAIQLRSDESWRRMAKIMSEVGFKYVAFALKEETICVDSWKENVEEVGDIFAKYGLKCIQTHAPYYDLLISAEHRDERMEQALLHSIEATKTLGAEICAVHPRSFIIPGEPKETSVDRAKSLQENLISFRPLVEECEKQGVLLGIENLMRYPFADNPYFYSWIVEDQIELIDKLNSKYACAIWDFGHANLVDTDHAERIRALGGRIKGTHVHNNGGIDDDHFPPFFPPKTYYVRRTVDWNDVLTALHSTGYNGYLTMETIFHPNDMAIEGYMHYLYDSICLLEKLLYKGKKL